MEFRIEISYSEFLMRNAALNQAKAALQAAKSKEEKEKAQAWIDKIIANTRGTK